MNKDFFEHQSRTLNALYEVSRVLGSSLEIDAVARRCLRALADNLDLEHTLLCMPSPDRTVLLVRAWQGAGIHEVARRTISLDDGPVAKVYTTGMPAVVTDPSEFGALHPFWGTDAAEDALVLVPVVLDRRCVGVLASGRSAESVTMIDEDLRVMKIVAALFAQTIHISELLQREREALEEQNRELREALAEKFQPDNLVGHSGAMQRTLGMVRQVAGTEASVLLRGESGTGKTLLARTIHFHSSRRQGPFVEVNCAALPASLIESELFGHERGAFTGAVNQRIGRFELARDGTLFLDEIGELPLETQSKILRVFQDGTFERLGSSQTISSNARIICATNCDLEAMVRDRRFREDLYYRQMVVPIHVPALRNRRSDIVPLVLQFLRVFMDKHHKRVAVSRDALEFLQQYAWPGNVRELENTIERTVVLAADGDTLGSDDIPVIDRLFPRNKECVTSPGRSGTPGNASFPLREENPSNQGSTLSRRPYQRAVLTRDDVEQSLHASNGHQTLAARSLGVTLRQFRYRVQQLGLDPRGYRR